MTDECEKAILIPNAGKLDRPLDGYDRLYFGVEFCQRLIPTQQALAAALERAQGKGFTLVTPFVTDAGLQRLRPVLDMLQRERPDAEVVVNDWGVLDYLHENHPNLEPVLGRLLVKQKRGPRILRIAEKLPTEAVDHFRRCVADSSVVIRFLQPYGVGRVELDNLLQGLRRDDGLPASLYYPYGYITTTRMCLTNAAYDRKRSFREIFPCKKDCQILSFTLRSPKMPVEIILRGNTQFYFNDRLPDNLAALGIDRLVYEPEPPL